MNALLDIIGKIANFLWGPWTMALIAVVGVSLTVRTGFFQFSHFGLIMKNTFGKILSKPEKEGKGAISPFAAAATALASTVGTGNIAGVATAISVGGPGAVFWMWLLALIGMISKVAEVTLAVHYRNIDENGEPYGGPMYYMTKGLGWSWLGKVMALGIVINGLVAAALLQPHTVGRALSDSYGINPYLTTTLMALITGIVVIGGIKRIGQFCEMVVPLMSVVYVVAGLFVFLVNFRHIPEVFAMIFKYAFSPAPAMGGFAGAAVSAAIQKGMSRGMLSNEAGLGTAPMAHAKAKVAHPFEQGMWGAFEVFVDTIVICTITAFTILSTGVINTGKTGIELTMAAFSSVFPPALAQAILSISILFFCLSTQIGFFVYVDTAASFLWGRGSMQILKWLYLLPGVIFAGVTDTDKLWAFADIATGVCSIPNLIGVLALSGVFLVLMKDWLTGQRTYSTLVVDVEQNYVRAAR